MVPVVGMYRQQHCRSMKNSSAASSTRGNQRCEQAMIISVTNTDDSDVVKQYQHQHHLVELNNTTSDNHPKRHSVKALTLTFITTPKSKGKQPHNTCTVLPEAKDSIKQPAENKGMQER